MIKPLGDRAEAGRGLAARLQRYAHRRDVLVLGRDRAGGGRSPSVVRPGAPDTCAALAQVADECVCVLEPRELQATARTPHATATE